MVGCAALCAYADLPVVTWVSYPVGAGDHVLVHGGAWGKNVRVVTDGERIAQMVVVPYLEVGFEVAEELRETERGEGGFGSTGTD